jgi:N4-gp56 family major capsid protein
MAGQIWAVDSEGGYMYADNLSQEMRTALQPLTKFRQFADVKDATQQGKKKGDTFHWDIYNDVQTQGGTLVETNTMPETNFTIDQGTLTITEYGNAVPYSGKLEALAQHAVRKPVMKALRNDAKKAFDGAAYDQFNSTLLRVVPTAGTATDAVTLTTNGTATLTNNVAFNNDHAKAIIDVMKERNIAPYEGDDYFALAWPTTFRTFKNNLESIHQYVDAGFQMIMNGEIGRYEGCRYVEQTHVAKGGAADSTTHTAFVADAWDNGVSDWIFFFGEDTVAEGIACPEEMRAKIPGDYGRSKGVAWYYLGGFGIVSQTAAEMRIVKWDSAS